jgi:hypothetical protein
VSPELWLYATWLGYALAAFIGFVFVAHMPILPLIRLASLPVPDKGRIALCFMGAWLKNCLMILPDLLAPVVVPVALAFTRWDAERLPRPFVWWDNDASINGDVRQGGLWDLQPVPLERDNADAVAMCYWAKGHHPRSFYARWVWLGLRNRASRLSQLLGTDVTGPATTWSGDGWTVTRVDDKWRYFELLPVGSDGTVGESGLQPRLGKSEGQVSLAHVEPP